MLVFKQKIGEGAVCRFMPGNPLYLSSYIGALSSDKDNPVSMSIFVEKIVGNDNTKLVFDDANNLFNIARTKRENIDSDITSLKLKPFEGVTIELLPQAHWNFIAHAFQALAVKYGFENNAAKAVKPMAVSGFVKRIDGDCVELEIDAPKDMFRVRISDRKLEKSKKKQT